METGKSQTININDIGSNFGKKSFDTVAAEIEAICSDYADQASFVKLVKEIERKKARAKAIEAYCNSNYHNKDFALRALEQIEETEKGIMEGSQMEIEDNFDNVHIEWLCKDLGMAAGDAMAIVAPSGVGKSHFASYIGLCVARGIPMFGQFKIDRPGKVAHLNWDSEKGLTQIGYIRLNKGINHQNKIDGKASVWFEKPASWKLSDPNGYDNLKQICKDKTLCIIDSLRASASGDENSSDFMKIIQTANRVSSETGCVILFIAHTGHGGSHIRGTSSVTDALGVIWTMEKKGAQIVISNVKGRYFQFKPFAYCYAETGEFVEKINKSERIEMEIHDYRQMSDEELILSTISNHPKITSSRLREATKLTTKCEEIVDELVKRGLVYKGSDPDKKVRGQIHTLTDEGENFIKYSNKT